MRRPGIGSDRRTIREWDRTREVAQDVLGIWDTLVADLQALTAEYEDDGWRTIAIYSGHSVPIHGAQSDKPNGISVTIPDNKFDELDVAINRDGATFDGCEVFKTQQGTFVFLGIVMRDRHERLALIIPAYYTVDNGRSMIEQALEEGEIHVHLRRLADERVVLSFDNPELFAPDSR